MLILALAVGAAAFTATTPAAAKRKPDTASEFGDELDLSLAFFREEGRPARDLAVLACSYALESRRKVRVLDACAGAGARTLRYLRDLPSDVEVLANEPNDGTQLLKNCRNFDNVKFASGDAGELPKQPEVDVVGVDWSRLARSALAIRRPRTAAYSATTGAAAAGTRARPRGPVRKSNCRGASPPLLNRPPRHRRDVNAPDSPFNLGTGAGCSEKTTGLYACKTPAPTSSDYGLLSARRGGV